MIISTIDKFYKNNYKFCWSLVSDVVSVHACHIVWALSWVFIIFVQTAKIILVRGKVDCKITGVYTYAPVLCILECYTVP